MTDTNNAGRPAAVEALRLVRELGRRFHAIPRSVSARTDFEIALNAVDAALAQQPEAPADYFAAEIQPLIDTAIGLGYTSVAEALDATPFYPARLAPDGGEVSRLAFHRHLQSRGIPSELFQHDDAGVYEFASVEHDWQVWSAALASIPASEPAYQPEWIHLKQYGYAPGNYMNKCYACSEVVSGLDKRATICRPCAESRHAALAASASVRGLATEASELPGMWHESDLSGGETDYVAPAATEAMGEGATEISGPSGDMPSDFQEGQWWLAKLDEVAAVGTDDFKRAVAVVRNMMKTMHAQVPAAPAEPVALGPQSRELALRGLLGVIGTAQAQARRIIASEGDADDLRQDRHDLPAALDTLKKAVESFAAPVSADAQKAVAREPLTEAQPNASPGMTFEESITITQEFRDNDNPF